ncbi:DEAD/DEAH box helicase family protein [Arthrobacter antioxidans]|uniref:DEAD/DEAH box helicase family protein n=1 Tax=Arthrobacter antioxidans TaxID=2895818 RepID=UPI0020003685|nr:DEAD/DEAH box helicase family protein [Arthrobacter antioxidans]
MQQFEETVAVQARPLAAWRFTGRLRTYQADVLERVPVVAGDPLHIVAPPGSGKTLLGLLLAARRGAPAVALAPTATIRSQWARAAEGLEGASGAVSEDPHELGDLTVLTYQMLSVIEGGNPLTDLAVAEWARELEAGGRTATAAGEWIEALRAANPTAFRDGVTRRSRTLRRQFAQQDADLLARVLHPNALALVDRLVEHGVETILLDECHHLLDHWALVVAYLASRIRDAGRTPLLIGLTATLPSVEDKRSYDNYAGLLGEVDYEVPTPAVVKEGNLAPYRDHVWFVEPIEDELVFLRDHERRLAGLIRELLAGDDGVTYVAALLQPSSDGGDEPPEQRLARAFASDFGLAESAARMLLDLTPDHPLRALLPPDLRTPPDTEQSVRLLARYALDRVLPDPSRADQWQRIKRTVADFGYTLTDRGVRRGRDPIDTLLASSAAKDAAVGDILRLELGQATGHLVRAVVIADFAVHGNKRGAARRPAGALRVFDAVAGDATLAALRPVLVTARHLRIAARDAGVLVPALSAALDADLTPTPVDGSPGVLDLDTAGRGSAAVVAAVSALLARGEVRVVVGTRGLLGEGWDCPAVNTLIDLTAVATSSSTQQLRGRTLRLDPAWPRKVAHNWVVTAVIPARIALASAPDLRRMKRKHDRIWGLLREDSTQVVRGLPIALTEQQAGWLRALEGKDRRQTVAGLNESTAAALPPREDSYRSWRIGEPYADREGAAAVVSRARTRAFRTGWTLQFILTAIIVIVGAVLVQSGRPLGALWQVHPAAGLAGTALALGLAGWLVRPLVRQVGLAARQAFTTTAAYRRVVRAVADALHDAGHVPAFGEGDIRVAPEGSKDLVERFELEVLGGSPAERRVVATALAELFGPVRSPRFLLRIDRGEPARLHHQPLLQLVLWATRLLTRKDRLLPVPALLGRRRADAEAFARRWQRSVGPCALLEIDAPEDLVQLTRARRDAAGSSAPPVFSGRGDRI